MRAKKFGVQLSSDAKKIARSERFGMPNKSNYDSINSNSMVNISFKQLGIETYNFIF